jgi:hypothetical protein
MPNRVPWTQRVFDFGFPTRRDRDTWSIQENLGHLADLEGLFMGRLDDFDARVATL